VAWWCFDVAAQYFNKNKKKASWSECDCGAAEVPEEQSEAGK